MAGGRPTKYRPEYCEKVIELFKVGASKHEICLELDICFETLINWGNDHPEFFEAIKKGLAFSQGKWEQDARLNMKDKDFNHVLWFMNMKNRFPRDWRDKKEIEQDVNVRAEEVVEVEEARNAYKNSFKKEF